jgi:hypothetical protein
LGCYSSSDLHLACGNETNLDCCEVTANTSDYGMAIITPDNFYSVLSCRPTPPEALSMLYGQCVHRWGTDTLPRPYLHQKWALRRFEPRLLVVFRCVNTCHVRSLDLSSSRSQTCLWNLARGVPSTPLLEELAPGWDVDVALDLTSCPELSQGNLFGLVLRVSQPRGTDSGPWPHCR